MTTHAEATFQLQSWDEQTLDELSGGRRVTRASVRQEFSGDLAGDGAVDWLMCYAPDGTAEFVGLQRLTGSVGGRAGSFVARSSGIFDGGQAKGRLEIVPGSATGDLEGLHGEGSFSAPHGPSATVTLDYDLG